MNDAVPMEAGDPTLNKLVGMTILVLSVIMSIGKIKDDNIVQAMQADKAQSVDVWDEYQAKKLKWHLAEQNLLLLQSLPDQTRTSASAARLQQDIARYGSEAARLKADAERVEQDYGRLGFKDDQFDLADALLSVAITLAGVVALTSQRWLLLTAWGFACCGMLFTLAGFTQWSLHPDAIIRFLT
jgi:hypothetical protein